MSHIGRKPPDAVIRILRNEVGFACPICGSPFLTWHHFDPPWRKKQHHNPEGMIALCPEHATHADGGHWTITQLRSLKHPLNLDARVVASWPWQPEKAVFMLGNSYYIGERPLLALSNRSVFSASKYIPPGQHNPAIMFSVNLQNETGKSLLSLKDNFLSFYASDLSDVQCPPQAKIFEAVNKNGISLKLQHKRLSLDAFLEQVPANTYNRFDTVENVSRLIQETAIDSEGMVPIIEISGDLRSEGIDMHLGRDNSTFQVKAYNNELVNMPGRFYSPILSQGAMLLKIGQDELLRFG